MKNRADAGAMPAKVSEKIRPIGHRRVRERGGAGEPIRRADVGADRGRGQCGPSGPGQREDQQHQACGGHDLTETVTDGYPVLAGDLHCGQVEHDVGQQRTRDRPD